jgi:hypothetical protein
MNRSDIIYKFYDAFAAADAETMVSYYHEQIEFEDPAFGKLMGEDAKNMWRMLIERSKGDIKITFDNVRSNENTGSANWKAVYHYGPKKRKVINNIRAEFEFSDGKIIKHVDRFDLWKWSRQALGLPGYILGWTSFLKNKIQKQTGRLLKSFSNKRI